MMDLMHTKQLLKLFSIVYLQILNTKVIIVNHLLVRNIVYNLYIQCIVNHLLVRNIVYNLYIQCIVNHLLVRNIVYNLYIQCIVNHLLVRNIVYNMYIQCTLNNFKSTLSNGFPVDD